MKIVNLLTAICKRYTWWTYSGLVLLLAGIYFGSLSELMLEVDDARTFRDNIAVAQDFTYLFSSDKEVGSGRLTSDFVRFIAYLLVGNQPGSVHLFLVAIHTLASLLLARLAWRSTSACSAACSFWSMSPSFAPCIGSLHWTILWPCCGAV